MTKTQAEQIVNSYLRALENTDIDTIMSLYALECTVEDPVGGEIQKDRDAVRAFYENLKGLSIKAENSGAICVTDKGQCIAFPFKIEIDMQGMLLQQDIIDVFYCDDENKIVRMQAFWGSENAHTT